MKICIDARMWGIKHTGIGRYIENLIDNLPGDVILIVPPDLKNEPKLAKFKKYYARFHPYSFLAQLEMLWILSFIRPNLLHVPHFTIPVLWLGKMIVTIHDLIKHLSRGRDTTTRHPFLYRVKYLGYLIIVWLAVHRAIHIIVPAKYWKSILEKKYRLNPAKISVTYEGVSPAFL
ncbi:MAG: glycosyltransferase [Patescibacteria group bacterium]